ncbi:DUF2975 domain-containing protein [Labrenzia sp. R4_2]|uniref:DUF2975 domain-containing protein n=2 Tax=Stappiaceae TaxID=2821832 RepID=UPI001AD9F80A|nr:DUF2975 domain-containing protein [Labrenzia sp. R4_2]MBO9419774.1 DUF2975 domain-containing protein [Labrenzia sp. R4_2]
MKTANLSDLGRGIKMVDASINEQSKRLKRIRIVARLVKWIATLSLLITLTVGIGLTFVFLFPQGPAWSVDETIWVGEGERALAAIPIEQRFILAVLLVVNFVLALGIIWALRSVCRHFESGDYFSPQALENVFSLGAWMISFAVFDIASDPVGIMVATLDYPEVERVIDVSLDGGEIFTMILGALMLLFGWIFREAALLAEENRQIV